MLGWTPLGEAARDAVFPPNSVGTTQLRGNAVTSPKIRNGSVQAIDVQKRTITAAHVKPGSLLASSFRGGQLPVGPKGDKGDRGERGPAGITNVFTQSVGGPSRALTATTATVVSVQLPRGKFLILGRIQLEGSEPNFTGICTTGTGTDFGPTTDPAIAAAYAGPAGANEVTVVSMHVVVDLAAPATALIRCRSPRAGFWRDARITALQIG